MPPEPVSLPAAVLGAATKKIAENVVNDVYSSIKALGLSCYGKLRRKVLVDSFYNQIKDVRQVKTILKPEKSVDLFSFYSPSRVIVGSSRIEVNKIDDITHEQGVVIEGIIGQGKTIFLRYIASNEFFLNGKIPVFVELRKIRGDKGLKDLIVQELKDLELDMAWDEFLILAGKGKVNLYLDAFDEVKDECRSDLVGEIESLARTCSNLRVVLTTRPQVWSSRFFASYKLASLAGSEYKNVVMRMVDDAEVSESVINGIEDENSSLKRLLRTPLMVALLVVRYKIENSLPKNEHAFYDSLMLLLLQRHDKAKSGYVRPRKSSLTDDELRLFFDALSFVTRKANELSFTRAKLIEYSRAAVRIVNLKCDVDKTIDDIIDITCLIVSDGQEDRFIHKGVQEYHAALFIKGQPDASVQKFYASMQKGWGNWSQELVFLSEIDAYRYNKFLSIPCLELVLSGVTAETIKDLSVAHGFLLKHFTADEVVYWSHAKLWRFMGFESKMEGVNHYGCFAIYQFIRNRQLDLIKMFNDKVLNKTLPADGKGGTIVNLAISELFSNKANEVFCIKYASLIYGLMSKELSRSKKYVESVDSNEGLFNF